MAEEILSWSKSMGDDDGDFRLNDVGGGVETGRPCQPPRVNCEVDAVLGEGKKCHRGDAFKKSRMAGEFSRGHQ